MTAPHRSSPAGPLGRLARAVRPRRWRLVGLSLVLLAYGLLWLLYANANGPFDALRGQLFGLVVTIPTLLILIAGGNLLSDWIGVRRRSPQFTQRERDDAHAAPPEGPSS